MRHLSSIENALQDLLPAAFLVFSLAACTHSSSPDAAGKGDAGGSDRFGPSDTPSSPLDAQTTCSENGVTYAVGAAIPRGTATCPVSCVCLEGGIVGLCTGACLPVDAALDLAGLPDGATKNDSARAEAASGPDLASPPDAVSKNDSNSVEAAGAPDLASLPDTATKNDSARADTAVPSDTLSDILPVDAQVTCSENGVTYPVGATIIRGGTCPSMCTCLKSGIFGLCTSICLPVDAGPDLVSNADSASQFPNCEALSACCARLTGSAQTTCERWLQQWYLGSDTAEMACMAGLTIVGC